MINYLMKLKEDAIAKIKEAIDLPTLDSIRVFYLSKKGEVSLMMGKLRDLPQEERPTLGNLKVYRKAFTVSHSQVRH